MDKKMSQFPEVYALDATSEIVILQGAPLDNKKIKKENFKESIGINALIEEDENLQSQIDDTNENLEFYINGLNVKLDKVNVYNGLDKNDSGFALDARQGKVLNDNIDTLSGEIGSESLARTAGDNALQASIQGVYTDLTQADMFLQSAITAETQARQNADAAAYAKAIEPIAYNATAPTPNIPIGTTKTYKFSTGGAVSWLSSQIMEVGDEADVTRTGESTYTRMSRNVLSRKLDDTQIYNDLDRTEEGFALDARQGKVLNDNIDTLSGEIGSESLARSAGDNALQEQINTINSNIGDIDTVLGILTGDISDDIDLAIQEMQGV